ncbi:hypothetical protein ACRAWF_06115 [Streptomyces sp. L7]
MVEFTRSVYRGDRYRIFTRLSLAGRPDGRRVVDGSWSAPPPPSPAPTPWPSTPLEQLTAPVPQFTAPVPRPTRRSDHAPPHVNPHQKRDRSCSVTHSP